MSPGELIVGARNATVILPPGGGTPLPHALRHTYLAEWLARDALNVWRDPLGQASLATVGRYLQDVAPVHVIETIKRSEWSLR
jgi:hypothetical protein